MLVRYLALRTAIPRRGIGTVPISLREMVEERRLEALRHLALGTAILRRGIGTVLIPLRGMIRAPSPQSSASSSTPHCNPSERDWYGTVLAENGLRVPSPQSSASSSTPRCNPSERDWYGTVLAENGRSVPVCSEWLRFEASD